MAGVVLVAMLLSAGTGLIDLRQDPACVVGRLGAGDLVTLWGPWRPTPACEWRGERSEAVVLGEASSHFTRTCPGRAHNIEQAAALLDGILLGPGEEFSFNATVGERSLERGFEPAPVFLAGGYGREPGGGVCQVSSTLYVAALFAGLDIEERWHHRYRVTYVPLGLDATVDYGQRDLRFRNPFPYPVRIRSEIDDGRLRVAVFGPMRLCKVAYEYEVLEEEPATSIRFRKRAIVNDPLEARGRPRLVIERQIRRFDMLRRRWSHLEKDEVRYGALPWYVAVTDYPDGVRELSNLSRSEIRKYLAQSKYSFPELEEPSPRVSGGPVE